MIGARPELGGGGFYEAIQEVTPGLGVQALTTTAVIDLANSDALDLGSGAPTLRSDGGLCHWDGVAKKLVFDRSIVASIEVSYYLRSPNNTNLTSPYKLFTQVSSEPPEEVELMTVWSATQGWTTRILDRAFAAGDTVEWRLSTNRTLSLDGYALSVFEAVR